MRLYASVEGWKGKLFVLVSSAHAPSQFIFTCFHKPSKFFDHLHLPKMLCICCAPWRKVELNQIKKIANARSINTVWRKPECIYVTMNGCCHFFSKNKIQHNIKYSGSVCYAQFWGDGGKSQCVLIIIIRRALVKLHFTSLCCLFRFVHHIKKLTNKSKRLNVWKKK